MYHLLTILHTSFLPTGAVTYKRVPRLTQFHCFYSYFPPKSTLFYTSTLTIYIFKGAQLGLVIAMPVSGILADTKLGWKLIFYSVSSIMMISTALWIFFSANSPKEHRLITETEREYIERGLNSTANRVCISFYFSLVHETEAAGKNMSRLPVLQYAVYRTTYIHTYIHFYRK